jgi:hypothetical protein
MRTSNKTTFRDLIDADITRDKLTIAIEALEYIRRHHSDESPIGILVNESLDKIYFMGGIKHEIEAYQESES